MSEQTLELSALRNNAPTQFETEGKALVPCPFCGSDDITIFNTEEIPDVHRCQCLACGCDGPWRDSRLNAIAIWNRRGLPSMDDLSAQEMKLALDECRHKNLWLVNENLKLQKGLKLTCSEVERLTMELNAATLGEATKQDVMLDKMHAVLIAAEKYIEGVNADWPKGMDSDRDELIERIKSAKPDENPDENCTA